MVGDDWPKMAFRLPCFCRLRTVQGDIWLTLCSPAMAALLHLPPCQPCSVQGAQQVAAAGMLASAVHTSVGCHLPATGCSQPLPLSSILCKDFRQTKRVLQAMLPLFSCVQVARQQQSLPSDTHPRTAAPVRAAGLSSARLICKGGSSSVAATARPCLIASACLCCRALPRGAGAPQWHPE